MQIQLKTGELLGLALRRLRERHGLTLRGVHEASCCLARELGRKAFEIPPSRLHEIESKGMLPTIYRAYTLARWLGCTG